MLDQVRRFLLRAQRTLTRRSIRTLSAEAIEGSTPEYVVHLLFNYLRGLPDQTERPPDEDKLLVALHKTRNAVSDFEVAGHLRRDLGDIGPLDIQKLQRSVPALTQLLLVKPSPKVREELVEILFQLRARSAAPAIRAVLKELAALQELDTAEYWQLTGRGRPNGTFMTLVTAVRFFARVPDESAIEVLTTLADRLHRFQPEYGFEQYSNGWTLYGWLQISLLAVACAFRSYDSYKWCLISRGDQHDHAVDEVVELYSDELNSALPHFREQERRRLLKDGLVHEFVSRNQEGWTDDDWRAFVSSLRRAGYLVLDDEMIRTLV